MANFDFKTATPDATFPSGGFLFGADSQSAATPSIYAGTTYLAYILGLANTWTAAQTISVNGAVSAPGFTGTGTWYTGGSATTTKPYVLFEPTGTTSTGWSTNGTGLGVNAPSGFSGNIIDAQINGASRFSVMNNGARVYQGLGIDFSSNVSLTAVSFGSDGGLEIRDINSNYGSRGIRCGFGLFDGTSISAVRVIAKGASGQTADLFQAQSSTASVLANITAAGAFSVVGGLTTGAPSGGTAAEWKLGVAATVSPTSPNRTIEVNVGGTTYYIAAKTTND